MSLFSINACLAFEIGVEFEFYSEEREYFYRHLEKKLPQIWSTTFPPKFQNSNTKNFHKLWGAN